MVHKAVRGQRDQSRGVKNRLQRLRKNQDPTWHQGVKLSPEHKTWGPRKCVSIYNKTSPKPQWETDARNATERALQEAIRIHKLKQSRAKVEKNRSKHQLDGENVSKEHDNMSDENMSKKRDGAAEDPPVSPAKGNVIPVNRVDPLFSEFSESAVSDVESDPPTTYSYTFPGSVFESTQMMSSGIQPLWNFVRKADLEEREIETKRFSPDGPRKQLSFYEKQQKLEGIYEKKTSTTSVNSDQTNDPIYFVPVYRDPQKIIYHPSTSTRKYDEDYQKYMQGKEVTKISSPADKPKAYTSLPIISTPQKNETENSRKSSPAKSKVSLPVLNLSKKTKGQATKTLEAKKTPVKSFEAEGHQKCESLMKSPNWRPILPKPVTPTNVDITSWNHPLVGLPHITIHSPGVTLDKKSPSPAKHGGNVIASKGNVKKNAVSLLVGNRVKQRDSNVNVNTMKPGNLLGSADIEETNVVELDRGDYCVIRIPASNKEQKEKNDTKEIPVTKTKMACREKQLSTPKKRKWQQLSNVQYEESEEILDVVSMESPPKKLKEEENLSGKKTGLIQTSAQSTVTSYTVMPGCYSCGIREESCNTVRQCFPQTVAQLLQKKRFNEQLQKSREARKEIENPPSKDTKELSPKSTPPKDYGEKKFQTRRARTAELIRNKIISMRDGKSNDSQHKIDVKKTAAENTSRNDLKGTPRVSHQNHTSTGSKESVYPAHFSTGPIIPKDLLYGKYTLAGPSTLKDSFNPKYATTGASKDSVDLTYTSTGTSVIKDLVSPNHTSTGQGITEPPTVTTQINRPDLSVKGIMKRNSVCIDFFVDFAFLLFVFSEILPFLHCSANLSELQLIRKVTFQMKYNFMTIIVKCLEYKFMF